MSEMLYKVNFIFSKELPAFTKTMISNEYVNLRNYACEALNPHYEEWNTLFNVEMHEIDKDSDNKAYLEFITKKQREVLTQVNAKNKSKIIELDVDEEANIVGRCKFDKNITVTAYLVPISN